MGDALTLNCRVLWATHIYMHIIRRYPYIKVTVTKATYVYNNDGPRDRSLGGDLRPTMPRCVCPKVKHMGHFPASSA